MSLEFPGSEHAGLATSPSAWQLSAVCCRTGQALFGAAAQEHVLRPGESEPELIIIKECVSGWLQLAQCWESLSRVFRAPS